MEQRGVSPTSGVEDQVSSGISMHNSVTRGAQEVSSGVEDASRGNMRRGVKQVRNGIP